MEFDREVEGRLGVVTVAVPGGALPGEVRVGVRGTVETFIAYADERLEVDTEVLVFRSRGPRSVEVMRAPEVLRGQHG